MGRGLDRLVDVATMLAGLSAVVVATVVVGRQLTGPPPVLGEEARELEDWDFLLDGARRRGPSDAPAVIVEFGDYECPACKGWQPHIDHVLARYSGQVSFVFKHWPLSYHPNAYPAARAAECAGAQGRFWEFHDVLYSDGDLSHEGLRQAASKAGVPDQAAFEQCAATVEPVPRIEADVAQAREIGARGTPTVIVNGLVLGAQRDSLFLGELIEEALR